uniref:Peroxisomal targeting signal 1 receptor n=1 Tax=Hirondellea gigas TaxID=1518452 RepID=A0A2P2I296_9CRUS
MAMHNLVEGQCGESNPLMRLTQHFTKDKALADEGLQWTSSFAFQDVGKAGVGYGGASAVDQMVEEFMTETKYAATAVPQPYRMDALLQEMREIESSRGPPQQGPAIADLASSHTAKAWAEEYLASEAQLAESEADMSRTASHMPTTTPYDLPYMPPPYDLPHHMPPPPCDVVSFHHMMPPPFAAMVHMSPPQQQYGIAHMPPPYMPQPAGYAPYNMAPMHRPEGAWSSTSDSRRHAETQQHYDPREDSELAKTANELLGTVDDPNFSNTEFVQIIQKMSQGAKSHDASLNQKHSSDAVSETVVADEAATDITQSNTAREANDWNKQESASDLSKHLSSDAPNSGAEADNTTPEQQWAEMQEKIDQLYPSDEANSYSDSFFNGTYGDILTQFDDYSFSKENPVANHPDPLEEGQRCLEAGDLPSAVLLFEAAVTQQPENPRAWHLLGTTQAENEKDLSAIPALKRCVKLDPSDSDAWMVLATSYANEEYPRLTCTALKEWLRSKSEYRLLAENDKSSLDIVQTNSHNNDRDLSKRMIIDGQSLFLQTANQGSKVHAGVDPEVQCGLGLLFHIDHDYDKAIDCFRAAVSSDPQNPRLWNKLGATLCTNNEPEEAVAAYQRALQLSPGFIRCRYNLGVACMKMKSYRESMDHFLSALKLQMASRGPATAPSTSESAAVSESIWRAVMILLTRLNMPQLYAACRRRELATITAAMEERSNDSS